MCGRDWAGTTVGGLDYAEQLGVTKCLGDTNIGAIFEVGSVPQRETAETLIAEQAEALASYYRHKITMQQYRAVEKSLVVRAKLLGPKVYQRYKQLLAKGI